ncbi:hypothetical protein [Chelativorans sp. AA-79]|uniref:hypothetical protein n=1 Tax=Chelativorans sp. AA-79 TaxID=3028735 RepID=UPI0023F6620D|nr:hypothetical protein [Chelativorans sp. AA-79]WEX10344.1 hypothetical protein PVE73_05120 [Chelativorans sp. AA-79]
MTDTANDVEALIGFPEPTYLLKFTHDGRIEFGPGLSADEATQGAAKMLAEHYSAAVSEEIRTLKARCEAAERERDYLLRYVDEIRATNTYRAVERAETAEARAKKAEERLAKPCGELPSPTPTVVEISETEVEAAARAIANAWGETWECCCTEQRGLDCDCGDAMTDERDAYDERLSREDCRMAARAALEAAALAHGEPFAWLCSGEGVNGSWRETDAITRDPDLATFRMHDPRWKVTPLYTHPVPQPSGPVEVLRQHDDHGPYWSVEREGKVIRRFPPSDYAFASYFAQGVNSALTSSKPDAPQAVPSGWQLVPEKLTPEMRKEFTARWSAPAHYADALWAAQLSAAPAASTAGGGDA